MSTHVDLRQVVHRLQLKIAIDGPAGAGKSTVGRGLAEALACSYLDTGIMYRAVTMTALRAGTPLDDSSTLESIAAGIRFSWSAGNSSQLLVDECLPDPELRSPQVDAHVSQVSAHADVRAVLVSRQRALAEGGCVVMVGRDIGTVVLPDAPAKLWVTASPEERARRREAETGPGAREVAGRLRHRDQLDTNRAVSPAHPAADASILNTEYLNPEESVHAALALVAAAVEREQASTR